TANGVTLDLGGYTVIYNNVDNQVADEQMSTSAFGVFADYQSDVKVLNGTIRQGKGYNYGSQGSYGYSPVNLYACTGSTEVAGIWAEFQGSSVSGIMMSYPGSTASVHHNVILDRGGELRNRHQGQRAIAAPVVHHNLVLRHRHRGVEISNNGSTIYDNELYGDSVATNGYSILSYDKDNVTVYGNRCFGTGYMLVGLGTIASCTYNELYDNLVHLQANENDLRWPEYGPMSWACGTRI
ncbi:unnamed protein product, partial [marine sediment metagenome]